MSIYIYQSPVGPLTLVSAADQLVGCYFANGSVPKELRSHPAAGTSDGVLLEACQQLDRFFARRLEVFTVPVAPQGTEFQCKVWRALRKIPFGKTVSYGYIAAQVGKPTAARAVGAANGRNPICIFVPCHRVIGADGSLTGFGGGMARKKYLLSLEQE